MEQPGNIQGTQLDELPPYTEGNHPTPTNLSSNLPGNTPGQPEVRVVLTQPMTITHTVQTQEQMPDDCLVWSIFGCLCCFFPTGFFAIVSSINARSAWRRHDYVSAKKSALCAKRLNIATLALGITVIVVDIMVQFVFNKNNR